jgi:GR25 family glycosyltransferase involved in LPS biosynthesis
MKSHQAVLEQAIADGVEQLLVLEDDVCFADDFCPAIHKFLKNVPDDWDQLMIGGQHLNFHGKPRLVKPGVIRCTDCQRMHCYAIRGEFLKKFFHRLRGGGLYDGQGHCDWILGRDPEMQLAHKVYAPKFFLAGQERSRSDIYGAIMPRRFWNPPDADLFVINLHAPAAVVVALREYGLCTGVGVGRDGNLHMELANIFAETKNNLAQRKHRLGNWIKVMQWELGADPFLFCTLSHPDASPQLVKQASPWRIYEVTAESVSGAIKQFPQKIRKALLAARRQLAGVG